MKTFDLGQGRKAVIVDNLNSLFPFMDGFFYCEHFKGRSNGKTNYIELENENYLERAISYVNNRHACYVNHLSEDETWIESAAKREGKNREKFVYAIDDDDDCD